MKYLAISRHSTIQLLLIIVASNAFVYQYNSVFIAILNPLNIHIDDLLTSYVVTGRFSIMGPLDNSIRFSTGWPMWAFTKAWAKLHMGFYEYIVHILLNYVAGTCTTLYKVVQGRWQGGGNLCYDTRKVP